tara:strand:+ start:2229 stop:3425 length:1197 start_codon:yes stop_codon:yes gene_type:complete
MSDISNVRSFTKNKNKICKLEINLNNWRTHPYNRVAFSNIEKILPISIIKKGNNSVRFKNKFEDLKTLTFLNKYKEHQSLKEYLKKNLTDTFLVIKKGNKVFEWLSENQNSNKPHILFSISKSLTGLIAGVLIEKRLIDESKNITFYIPEIKNSAYDNASIRNLLDMTVSSNFQEEYLDKSGLFNLYRQATGFNPRDTDTKIGLKGFLKLMPKSQYTHGNNYQYCSPNTDLFGWIVEKVTNKKFSDFFSEEIFQKCNPNFNAFVTLDDEGSPRTAGGICMNINDLAKIAELVRCKGALENKQIINENTIAKLIDYEAEYPWPNVERGRLFPKGGYRSNWYQTGHANKEICAIGIHGQWIWIDQIKEISIVMFSSRKMPLSISKDINFSLLCEELCKAI